MLRPLTALTLLLAAGMVEAVAADAVPKPSSVPSAAARVDETALRYYASLGRRDRVEAEARRLGALHPAWKAPTDLWSAHKGRDDEGPLWALYAQDRLSEIDKAVALRQAAEPGWTPSEDLQSKIRTKVLRARLLSLAGKEQWHGVVDSLHGSGIGWAKDDAQALWIIAEAYANENDCAEAYVVYRSILDRHDDPAERRATIEFAIRLIPMDMVEKLLAVAKTDEAGRSEFEPIAIDITRARISAFLHDEPAKEVGDAELTRFEDFVREAADPNEPALVAWYGYKRADYTLALDWFKRALSRGGDAMVAHGLAHTLRQLGLKREAEEVAYAWREPLINNSILFIDLLERDLTKAQPPFIEPERVQRYAKVTLQTESGEGAQALAWYAYNTCQYPTALRWFEHAVAWLPKQATVYGYALSLQRMHRGKELREVVNRYDGLFPKVVALAFDDGLRPPPPPCETTPGAIAGPARAATAAAVDWTGRTMADTLRTTMPISALTTAARAPHATVPSPDEVASGTAATTPLVKRLEFPVAVAPDNPLRFSALHTVPNEDAGAKLHHEPPGPLVARRVPGVGAMPYERWGFTLLPGWDGTRDASSPTAAEHEPPAGSLWALELSLREGGSTKRRPVSATRPAPAAATDAASGPDASRTGRPS